MKYQSILITVFWNDFAAVLRLIASKIVKLSIVRLCLFVKDFVQFSVQTGKPAGRSRRALVTLPEAGDSTTNLASVIVAKAEQSANAGGIDELWYEISISPSSQAIDKIHDLFALVCLSSRTRLFSITVAKAGLAIPEVDRLKDPFQPDHPESSNRPYVAYLAEVASRDQVLSKPFHQSEIVPNDYLKRASEGKKVILLSVSDAIFTACWKKITANSTELFGVDTDSLYVLADIVALPSDAVCAGKLTVQLLHPLGFTPVERLALAKKVDYLVADRGAYVLSAAFANVTTLIPRIHESRDGSVDVGFTIANGNHAAEEN